MDGWPDDPGAGPLDDMARLLGQLEALQETRAELGKMPLEELGFENAGATPASARAPGAFDSDCFLDPLARQLGALEDFQESLCLPPSPKLENPEPYAPEVRKYGSFHTRPPLAPADGGSGVGHNWAGPRLGPHPVGRSAGIRGAFGSDSQSGSIQPEFWCLRLGQAATGPHSRCEACDRDCGLADAKGEDDEEEEE